MKSLLTLVLLLSASTFFAQEKSMDALSEVQKLSKNTAEYFSNHEIEKAFDGLKTYWPLPEDELNALQEKTLSQLSYLKENYGKAFGYVKVKEKLIPDVAYREVYFVQYEYLAIRLVFTYYKNQKGWMLNSFKWDDDFTDELNTEEFINE